MNHPNTDYRFGTRTLYDFQYVGVEFLIKHKDWCNRGAAGGFLWDDPGLGKTTQAIVAAARLDEYPVLVVCPNSLKAHWRREILAICPSAKVTMVGKAGRLVMPPKRGRTSRVVYKPVERSISPDTLERTGADWVIVHYTGLRLGREDYASIPWATIIADESHYVKNQRAARTKALLDITPSDCHRIGLTATPWSKDPSDLWAQLSWVAPNVKGLQNYWRWFNLFTEYTWEARKNKKGKVIGKFRKISGGKNLDMLAQVMAEYGLCRRKSEVASQLPPITDTYMPLVLEAGSRQKVVLDALMDTSRNEFAIRHSAPGEDAAGSSSSDGPHFTDMVFKNVLARMMAMERWLSNPAAIDPGVEGVKMAWLNEWASSFPYPGVVVTRFKSSARMIAKALDVPVITGDVSIQSRDVIVEKWRAGEAGAPQFLVGTIHTLGTGLNLERAHAMVCFDQVYNPILMTQVRERVHRITSTHPVEVIYLVVQGTTNEIVYEAFKRKWKQMEIVKRFIQLLRGDTNGEGSDR